MNKVITVTTDFGDQFAASQLHAVVARLGFEGRLIENHSVTPFSIKEGAFELEQLASFSPYGSIHVGVIDPGVGSKRLGIVVQTSRSWLIGPNNGLLYPTARKEGILKVWHLHEAFFGHSLSQTFHGRDIFIKVAVYLSKGKYPIEFQSSEISEDTLEKMLFLEGEILHIDAYGNYKIYWPHTLIIGKQLVIKNQEQRSVIVPVVKTFDDAPKYQPLAYCGSHGTLELAVNLSCAVDHFRFKLGEKLTIQQI